MIVKTRVNAERASARRFLRTFVDMYPVADGGGLIRLRAGSLAEPAEVRLMPAAPFDERFPRYAVQWRSAVPGPYPDFNGVLSVADAENDDAFWILLDGAYQPPFEAAGDSLRVANATAQTLLGEIKGIIEASVAREAAAR